MPESSPHVLSTSVIFDAVDTRHIAAYEDWLTRINGVLRDFAGFAGAEVIRPQLGSGPPRFATYIIVLLFHDDDCLTAWLDSTQRAELLDEAKHWTAQRPELQRAQGLEVWFEQPEHLGLTVTPAYYKRVILGIVTVYPLILLSNWCLSLVPGFNGTAVELQIFASVVLVSLLLTYPVMPWASRALERWLYPAPGA